MDTTAATITGDASSPTGPRPELDERLSRGTLVGRYVILELVGTGGMGAVYAAYDPELDRKIALKLVRGGKEPRLLLHEAQAMAKLAHPGVVAVHDVGVVQGRVFIAMEFVEGTTLAGWLERSRPWTAVVDVFVRAGAGLLAAHDAGLVHRDFKPANVLIGGDGRVRVTDFGLARVHDEAQPSSDGALPTSSEATAATGLVGTPAYMSPEQALGERADARSDQFSFCAALYEALYGRRPFAGTGVFELLLAVSEGRVIPPPKTSNVPGWLRAIVMRGLSRERDDRFAGMKDLLDALEAGRRPSRWPRVGLGLLGVGLVALALALAWPQPPVTSDPCAETAQQITPAWDPSKREAVRAALVASALRPEPVLEAIDAYADAWTQMRRDSCEATRVAGTQSDELMDLRSECLDRRRDELGASIELFAAGDRGALAEALRTLEQLEPLELCADAERLRMRAPLPREHALREAVLRGEEQLAQARARFEAGQTAAALARLDELPARALEHAPLAAATANLRGGILEARGDHLGAEQAFAAAELDAARGGDDRLLVELGIARAQLIGGSLGRPDEARVIMRASEVLLTRIGRPTSLDRRLRAAQAFVAWRSGKPDEALVVYEALQRELAAEGRSDSLEALDVDRRVAALLANLGHYERAKALFERGIASLEARVGDNHPALVSPLTNLAAMVAQHGEFERSLELHGQIIALAERTLGPAHPDTATAHESLGVLLNHAGRNAEARRELEQAEASYARSYDAGHPSLARVRGNLAAVLIELGELEPAERVLVSARDALRSRFGDEHDYLVFLSINLGDLYLRQKRWDDARAAIREALRIAERRLGPQSERAGECWSLAGAIELDAGQLDAGLAKLERARTILLDVEASPLLIVAAEGALAQALVQSGRRAEGEAMFAAAVERVRSGALGPEPSAALRDRAQRAGIALVGLP